MADAARNITIKVLLDEAKARLGLKQMGQDADDTGSRWSKMGATAKAGLAVAGAAVVSFLADATKEAIADEAAQRQLALAVQNSTGATDLQVAALESYITKTQAATGITDEELRPAFANLVRATGDVTEAQELMTTAMDIATARGLPLEQVTLAIGKAAQGNVGALGRMGLQVRDAEGNFLDFEEAIAAANETMGGATAAAAETTEGKMRRLSVAVDEAKEAVGTALIPVLEAAIPIVTDLGKAAGLAGIEFQQWTGKLSDADAAIATFEALTGDAADTAEDALVVWKDSHVEFGKLLDELNLAPGELSRLIGATDEYLHSIGMTDAMIVQYRDNLADATYESGVARSEAEKHRLAQEELGGSYTATTDEIYAQIDAEKSLTDPMFALISANERLKTAHEKYTEAVMLGGPHSQDAIAASIDLTKAQQDAKIAAEKFGLEGGPAAIEAFRVMATEAGLSADAIDRIIRSMQTANQTPFNPKRAGELESATGRQAGRQAGGPVTKGTAYTVGEAGPETFVPNTSGRIVPHGRGRATGGSVNHITINAGMGSDPNAISKAVVEALQRYERSNGVIPVRTR